MNGIVHEANPDVTGGLPFGLASFGGTVDVDDDDDGDDGADMLKGERQNKRSANLAI